METNNINKFIIFCLENYKRSSRLSALEALADFKHYDVFSYLSAGYDVLHTQGHNYILQDIHNFISNRKQA